MGSVTVGEYLVTMCLPPPPGKIPDAGIQRSKLSMLDCGFMFDPVDWSVATALADLENSFRTEIANAVFSAEFE